MNAYNSGRKRRIAHLEVLAHRQFMDRQTRLAAINKMLRDAFFARLATVCLIIRYGAPRMKEPLAEAWQRSMTTLLSEFPGFAENGCASPFDRESALLIARDFRTYVLPRLPGADDNDKVYRVLRDGPQWLLWHAHVDQNCRNLGIKVPRVSSMRHFARDAWYFQLPKGPFELRKWRADEHNPVVAKKAKRRALESQDERTLRELARAHRVVFVRRLIVDAFNEQVARGEIKLPPNGGYPSL
jgi:hypothetical protein